MKIKLSLAVTIFAMSTMLLAEKKRGGGRDSS